MVTLATLPLSTVPVTVMLADGVVFSSRVVRTAFTHCGQRPAGRAQEAPDAEAQCRSRQDGRHQEHTLFGEPGTTAAFSTAV